MFEFLKKDRHQEPQPPDNIISLEQLIKMNVPSAQEINMMLENGTAKRIPKTNDNGEIIREEIVDQNGRILSFLDLEGMTKAQKIEMKEAETTRKKDEHDRRLRRN